MNWLEILVSGSVSTIGTLIVAHYYYTRPQAIALIFRKHARFLADLSTRQRAPGQKTTNEGGWDVANDGHPIQDPPPREGDGLGAAASDRDRQESDAIQAAEQVRAARKSPVRFPAQIALEVVRLFKGNDIYIPEFVIMRRSFQKVADWLGSVLDPAYRAAQRHQSLTPPYFNAYSETMQRELSRLESELEAEVRPGK